MPPIPSSWLRAVLLLGCCAALLVPALADQGASPRAAERETDPLPLRRLLIPPESVPAALEKVRRGVLKQLPAAEFEAKVKEARRAVANLNLVPRLVEARYSARLKGSALDGKGAWTVTNPRAAGVLPLPDLNLALKNVQPGVADVILGDLDGKGLGLLVKNPGKQAMVFDWTARGDPGSDGLHFKLKVPPCPVASLELTLPGDRLVRLLSRTNCVLTRLSREGEQKEGVWQVSFSGRPEVDLVIHPTSGPAPLVLTRLETDQRLTPDRVQAEFRFQVEVLHNIARKLYFECDPALKPYDVSTRGVDLQWELHDGPRPGAPRLLVIELREPVLGPLPPLTILGLAPVAVDKLWTCPGLTLVKVLPWGGSLPGEQDRASSLDDPRLVPTLTRGETLTLQVHPDVRLENWQTGGFRLVKAEVLANRFQVLALADGSTSSTGKGSRPSALVRTRGFDCLARQLTWWQIEPQGETLTAQVTYEVAHGRLFQLRLALPPGWEVERFDLEPANLLRNWAQLEGKSHPLLVVDLQRALLPQTPVRLTARLHPRHPRTVPAGGAAFAFPDVEPLDADLRTGALAVSVSPLYQATVGGSSVPPAADGAASSRAPWKGRPLTFSFPFRMRVNAGKPRPAQGVSRPHPAVTGTLHLRPHSARLRARCTTEVVLTPERASADVRLQLQPEAGRPDAVDLRVSVPVPGPWSWKTEQGANQVRTMVPLLPSLLGLGAGTPLDAINLLAACPRGQCWRLTFAQPLQGPLTLKASFALPARPAGPRDVPLLTVPAADPLDGEVTLYLAGADLFEVKAEGLREIQVPNQANRHGDAALPWRTYHYGHPLFPGAGGGLPPSLSLARRGRAAGRSLPEVIDQSLLTTYAEPGGRLLHHYAFRVWHWRRRTLTVRLPAPANLLAVKAYGRWISPLARVQTSEGMVLELQVASGMARHSFELIYASRQDRPAWALWSRLEAPVPALPVPPITFRRVWRLAPGLTPLTRRSLRCLPGPGPGAGVPDLEAVLGLAARPGVAASERRRQQRLLARAGDALRKHRPEGQDWKLGPALGRLAFDHLKDRAALVLDVEALRSAGLGPDTSLPPAGARDKAAPPWEGWGLVYVPCGGAPLLTTRGQREAWQAEAGRTNAVPATVEEAVTEAAVYGHDSSGRFRSVIDWLRVASQGEERGTRNAERDNTSGEPRAADPHADWVAWEPLAGTEEEDVLWVVRQEGVPVLGLTLAAVLVLAAVVVRRRLSPCWRYRLVLAWLAGAGLAFFWLPGSLGGLAWWPALAGAAVAVVWYLWSTAARQRRARAAVPSPAKVGVAGPVIALLALVGSAGLAGWAAAPAPFTVLLVPGSDREPDKQSALVPPELLARLDRLTRQGALQLPGAVILSAEYKGTVNGDNADFEADFQVYYFRKETTLTLPLENVLLKPRGPLGEPAFFAGKKAYPVARVQPQGGYSLPLQVERPDTYKLELRFTVRVARSGDERELRFTVPPLAQSRLTLALPAGARDSHDDTGLGAQRLKGSRLKVDLGRVGSVRVGWRHPKRPAPPATVRVQEAYLWDLRRPDSSLSGVLQYTVSNGTVSHLVLGLPEGIEVRSVEVRRWPPAGNEMTSRLLNKSWRLLGKGPGRQLLVNLHRPVTGGLQMILELIPRLPAGPGILPLFLPTPFKDRTPLLPEVLPGTLAYRIDGREAAPPEGQHLGTASIKPAVFVRNWRQLVQRTNDPGLPTRAYSFRRMPGGPAVLRLALKPPEVHAAQTVSWRIRPRHADVRATVKLTSPGRNLMLIEWEVPALTVAEVSGPQVQHWTQTGSRVQVWLKAPCAETAIELSGWLTAPPVPATAHDQRRLALPCLQLVNAESRETEVRVAAVDGLDLQPVQLRNLTRVAENTGADRLADRELVYTTQQAYYETAFAVRAARAQVQVLTRAEVRDRQLVFTSRLDFQVAQGELRTLKVRLRNWYGETVRLEAAGVIQRQEERLSRGERTWTLSLQPGVDRRYAVTLTAQVPLDAVTTVLMPDVSAAGGNGAVTQVGRWLRVAGPDLSAEDAHGLAPVAGPAVGNAGGKGERGQRTWRVVADPWQLRLRPRLAAGPSKVHLLLDEQAAAVVDGRRWVHQARYWLYAEAGTDLRLGLPAGASVLAVSIDGIGEIPRQPKPGQLWLALPGGAGVRAVRVSWMYPERKEPLDRPRLTRPRLRTSAGDVTEVPPLWTVHVPAGYQVDPDRILRSRRQRISAAVQDLRRAGAQLKLSSLLADRVRGGDAAFTAQFLEAQDSFAWYCRHVGYRLALAARLEPGAAAENRRLEHRLAELRRENDRLLRSRGLEQVRARIRVVTRLPAAVSRPGKSRTAGPHGFDLPERGTPTYWQTEAPARSLRLRLRSGEVRRYREALVGSGLLLVAFVMAWILSYFPRLLALVQGLWPEQVVLLGWLAWQTLDLPLAGLPLMALGITARVWLLGRWALGLVRRITPAAAPPGAGSAPA